MPINQNVSASDHTKYVKERSIIVGRKWVPSDFSTSFYNSQLFYSSIAKRLTPLPDDVYYGGLLFNSGYLNVAPKTSLSFGTGDFTIEWFMKLSNITTGNGIFSIVLSPTSKVCVGVSGGAMRAGIDNGDDTTFGIATYSYVNVWTHCYLQRSAGVFRVAANGLYSLSRTVSFPINGGSLRIGADFDAGGNIRYLNGSISNFRVTLGTALYATTYTQPSLPLSGAGRSLLLISTARNPYKDTSSDSANSGIIAVGIPPGRISGPFDVTPYVPP